MAQGGPFLCCWVPRQRLATPAYAWSIPRTAHLACTLPRRTPHRPDAAAGAPAPGLDYLDWLAGLGALRCAPCSFPRMGQAAGGLATCGEEQWGDTVLHVFCGAGALTKLLASQGLQVSGGASPKDSGQFP